MHALFRLCLVPHPKIFYLSHQIFRHIHETLNVDTKINYLHNLVENHETNLLSLVSQRLA